MADGQLAASPDQDARLGDSSDRSAQRRTRWMTAAVSVLGVILAVFTLIEVNFNWLQPQAGLALFALLGYAGCFLMAGSRSPGRWSAAANVVLLIASVVCFAYIVVQTQPVFRAWWWNGQALGHRVAQETWLDVAVGVVGLLVVLYAAQRTLGWVVPLLALAFVAHSFYCHMSSQYGWPMLPDALLPHRGQSPRDLVSTTFLQSQGVLGQAMNVMFRYVFLFIVFGAMLEMSGATQFIIQFSQRVFARSPGGPAKMAVMASGMMGSLSGSAVANAVTTGTFTIPMMRNSGFRAHDAAAVEAAAGSGGALVPPVMGAGAYMMLEFIEPSVTYLDIVQAAILPALLYYWSLFVAVHFYARRMGAGARLAPTADANHATPLPIYSGVIFFVSLAVLMTSLIGGASPFRAVSLALIVILGMSVFSPNLGLPNSSRLGALAVFAAIVIGHQAYIRLGTSFFELSSGLMRQWESILNSGIVGMFGLIGWALVDPQWRRSMWPLLGGALRNGIPLITAAACVGIIIGVVQQTGIANDFSFAMKQVVEQNLLMALIGIMVTSIVMGLGVPSVVCYLLIATIMGSLLKELGVAPLAAHLFIFYFGLMSMVTPPVALAAYAAASIAGANALQTSWAAFRFALVGFTLPFMFVYRPVLLLLGQDGGPLGWDDAGYLASGLVAAVIGIVALAASLQGFLRAPLSWAMRLVLLLASLLLIAPDVGGRMIGLLINGGGLLLFICAWMANRATNRVA